MVLPTVIAATISIFLWVAVILIARKSAKTMFRLDDAYDFGVIMNVIGIGMGSAFFAIAVYL